MPLTSASRPAPVLLLAVSVGFGLSACKKAPEKSAPAPASAAAAVAPPVKSATPQPNPPAQPPKRYEVESGEVQYKQTGVLSGTETLYFKDFGRREMRETKVKVKMPKLGKIPGANLEALNGDKHTITVIESDTLVNYDVATKMGTKLTNTFDFFGGRQKLSGQSMTQLGLEMIKSLGGTNSGEKKKVAGLECDVWVVEQLHGEVCVHKGISLQTKVNNQGVSFSTEATKVDLKAKIPDDKFKIPADVKLETVDARDLMKKSQKLGYGGQPGVASGSEPKPGQLTPKDVKKLQEQLKQMTKKGK